MVRASHSGNRDVQNEGGERLLCVRIPETTHKRVHKVRVLTGKTLSRIVHEALQAHIERHRPLLDAPEEHRASEGPG